MKSLFKRKPKLSREDAMFMLTIETFFIKKMSLKELRAASSTSFFNAGFQRAVEVIKRADNPSRDTVLLIETVARLDKVLVENQRLRSELSHSNAILAAFRESIIKSVNEFVGR